MDMFDLSPEELSALALAIAIGLAKQYPDDGQLGILTAVIFLLYFIFMVYVYISREN